MNKIGFLILSFSLNIFAMSATQLQTINRDTLGCIKGIGEKRLNAILKYRDKNKISKIDDLLNVSGIGKKTLENIKNDIKKKSCQVNKQKQMQPKSKKKKKKLGAE